jgi:hypothetical protein
MMNAGRIERIQNIVEHAASALLAGSLAFAAYEELGGVVGQRALFAAVPCLWGAAYFVSGRLLFRRRSDEPRFEVPGFALAELHAFEPDELVLTADMVSAGPRHREQEPLVLDDILAELGPDSRVVRLFDPSAMPTPGHLKARIDDHLGQGRKPAPDASEALSEALAELRRSLR